MACRFQFVTALALVAALTLAAPSLDAQSGNDLFQKALSKERVDGQLAEAIALYQQVVRDFAADRPLAAKALLQMGRCYERLGRIEAQQSYERLLREYGDQRATADDARARLAVLAGQGPGRPDAATRQRAGGMSSRHVWTLPAAGTISGTVSHDGRYVPYTDWAIPNGNGELFFHDTASGANRRITRDVEQFGSQFVENGGTFSPDDAEFAYSFFNKDHAELRIIGVKAPANSRPRVVFSNPDVSRLFPDDWSPDGKWLAVQLKRSDKTTQIGLIAVQDGALRVLKSVEWRGSSKLFFSPDSKHVAYDLPSADGGVQRDVFIMAIDGSREVAAVVHPANDVLVGWSPGGTRLLFTSDRAGSTALWALPLVDGKPHGAPEQIKAAVAGASMGVTSQGMLYSFINHTRFATTRSDIHVAAFDFARAQFLSPPAVAVHTFVGANNFPAWSPDGKSLAFLSRRGEMAEGSMNTVIGILPEAGQLRELRPQLDIYAGGATLRWAADGRSLTIRATDAKGRRGLFRVDAETGVATPIALRSAAGAAEGGGFSDPIFAGDGAKVFFTRLSAAGAAGRDAIISERDLSTGTERELMRRTQGAAANSWMFAELSPDGRYLAAVDNDAWPGHDAGAWTAVLIPVAGGEARELLRGESYGADVLMWAPDSRALFVSSIKAESGGDRDVWRIAIDGSRPQKLDWDLSRLGPPFNSDQQLHSHPDGTRVAFAATEPAKPWEVWALENFLPGREAAAATSRKPR